MKTFLDTASPRRLYFSVGKPEDAMNSISGFDDPFTAGNRIRMTFLGSALAGMLALNISAQAPLLLPERWDCLPI